MPTKLPDDVLAVVRACLDDGLTDTAASKHTGLARSTIQRIRRSIEAFGVPYPPPSVVQGRRRMLTAALEEVSLPPPPPFRCLPVIANPALYRPQSHSASQRGSCAPLRGIRRRGVEFNAEPCACEEGHVAEDREETGGGTQRRLVSLTVCSLNFVNRHHCDRLMPPSSCEATVLMQNFDFEGSSEMVARPSTLGKHLVIKMGIRRLIKMRFPRP